MYGIVSPCETLSSRNDSVHILIFLTTSAQSQSQYIKNKILKVSWQNEKYTVIFQLL